MSRASLLRGAALLLCFLVLPQGSASRDRGADGQFSQRRSTHFVLYQDVGIDGYSGPKGSRRFERDVLDVLEEAYDRVTSLLGVRPVRPIEVVVYDEEVFDSQFGDLFGFRAAGFYHGLIRVRGAEQISTNLVRTLQHEYVHAALDSAAPSVELPAWLNEGLAEWVEAGAVGKRLLDRMEVARLSEAQRSGRLPSLPTLRGRSFVRLDPEEASLAYLVSYAMIEHLVRKHGEALLRRFVGHAVRTGNVERALDRTYRRSAEQLEADLHAELASSR